MHSLPPTASSFKTIRAIKIFILTIFVPACFLSIRATYDIIRFNIFPTWFVPGFGLVVFMLIAVSLYFVLQAWKIEAQSRPISGKQSVFLWTFMVLSFICTASVHGFYPFRSDVLSVIQFQRGNTVLMINFIIAALGFAASAGLAGLYIFGRMKTPAVIGLLVMALLTLIPNDNCANPFNYWWIEKIGASPLMYTPNLYAALFVTSGLYGIRPKVALFLTVCICVGSLLLGLGHQFRIIW
jgi:hypothetical protein